MDNKKFHLFLHKQILPLLGLSLLPGLGYIFLGWLNDVVWPAVIWYSLILLVSIWGYHLHKSYFIAVKNKNAFEKWYQNLIYFYYIIFLLWVLIFVLYSGETQSHLHYIAIFTELGASVVASTLLFPDKKIYFPVIVLLMLPLSIYFAGIHEWYGYVLSLFSLVFMGVLFYAATSSNKLLIKTDYQASHDSLTGLYNRNHFIEYFQRVIDNLKSTGLYSYLLLIDLDHFKTINDSLGHDIGDQLLINVSIRMKDHLSKQHTLARLGGDEFVIIGPEFKDLKQCQEQAVHFSQQLLDKIKKNYIIDPHHLYISASIGLNILSNKNIKAASFIKEADIAMYEVKASGRDGLILFNDEFSEAIEKKFEIERLLYFSLENNEIQLKFQPQMNLHKEIVGCEVLVRWHNKKLGFISPVDFIPIAEQTGFIIELGAYILEESIKKLDEWKSKGIVLQQFSINISMRQIFHHGFINNIESIYRKYNNPDLFKILIFELTETIVAEDIKKLIAIMNTLKKLGIRFSMDDFGTGYSSLSYISQLPIDELKIDRSFVSNLHKNEQNKSMVSTILNLAKTFDLSIVAEGVETDDQINFLTKNECHILQGFYFSQPVEDTEFEQLYIEQIKERDS